MKEKNFETYLDFILSGFKTNIIHDYNIPSIDIISNCVVFIINEILKKEQVDDFKNQIKNHFEIQYLRRRRN